MSGGQLLLAQQRAAIAVGAAGPDHPARVARCLVGPVLGVVLSEQGTTGGLPGASAAGRDCMPPVIEEAVDAASGVEVPLGGVVSAGGVVEQIGASSDGDRGRLFHCSLGGGEDVVRCRLGGGTVHWAHAVAEAASPRQLMTAVVVQGHVSEWRRTLYACFICWSSYAPGWLASASPYF